MDEVKSKVADYFPSGSGSREPSDFPLRERALASPIMIQDLRSMHNLYASR